jgi:hypothetical protein
MSNLIEHTWTEFRAAGWCNDARQFEDEMQEMICKHILALLEVFSDEGHSGSSASYAINLFSILAKYEPIAPLTGEDWEWGNVSEYGGREGDPLYQNKRCGRVFKDSNGAYDIEGIVWYDWYTDEKTGERYKSYFTDWHSRVPVTFPYKLKTEYRERGSNE